MARRKKKEDIEAYQHEAETRKNAVPIGLALYDTSKKFCIDIVDKDIESCQHIENKVMNLVARPDNQEPRNLCAGLGEYFERKNG